VPKKVRLSRLRLITRVADCHVPTELTKLSAADDKQESSFRVLRAVLPPVEDA
jgi:hypothetical protein